MARRPSADLEFVRVGIGKGLRALYSDIMSEAIPENLTDLLKQLGQPTDNNSGDDK